MKQDPNSVKIASERTYHHGDLRAALLAAAEQVLEERGADGFSLRETARRAGVSPSAPAHHFGDSKGLLTALAASAFAELAAALEAAAGKDRADTMRRQGIAYVRFALRRRAKFDLMWRAGLLNHDDPALAAASARAFGALDGAVRGGAVTKPAEAIGPEAATSIACWSMVHGFVRLCIDGAFGAEPGDAERAAERMLGDVLGHLVV